MEMLSRPIKMICCFLVIISTACSLDPIDAPVEEPEVIADFSFSPNSCQAPCSISFTDLSQNATQWKWNFGDPSSGSDNESNEKNPSHTYAVAGEYTVTLEASSSSKMSQITKTVTITQDDTPMACFTADPLTCDEGCVVTFEASCSQNAQTFSWDFDGDGTVDTTLSTSSIEYTYNQAGTYNVKLEIMNQEGDRSDTIRTIQINVEPTSFEITDIGGNGSETCYGHIIDSEGNYVVVGRGLDALQNQNSFAFKVLRNGAINWEQPYTQNGQGISFESIVEFGDEYILFSRGSVSSPGFRIDRSGSVVLNSQANFPYTSVIDPIVFENQIVYHSGFIGQCAPCALCWDFLALTDENGNDFSPNGFSGIKTPYQINDIELDLAGNILVSGYSFELDQDGGCIFDKTISSFARLNADLDYTNDLIQTDFDLPGGSTERIVDSEIDANGNIYHLMYTSDANESIALIKMDSEGNFVFPEVYKSFSEFGFKSDIPVSIDVTLDNHLIIAGHTSSFSIGVYKIFLLKVSLDGEPVWSNFKLFGDNLNSNMAVKVLTDPSDGGYSVSGLRGVTFLEAENNNLSLTNGDFYFFKTDEDGNIQ